MSADSQCIVSNISQVPGSARTIFAQFGGQYPGISPQSTVNWPTWRKSDFFSWNTTAV